MAGRAPRACARGQGSADLPPPDTVRWVARRKEAVVKAVRDGRIGRDRACALYRLSPEELDAWERVYARHGLEGLLVTRPRHHRH